MFKISPIQSEELKEIFLKECGAEAKEGYFAYRMAEEATGEIMGIAQFEICEGYGYISDLKPRVGYSDFEAMFILGRSTMNFIDMCGAHKCRAAKDAGEKKLLVSIGFKEDENGEYYCDMTDMFSGHCNGEAVKLT